MDNEPTQDNTEHKTEEFTLIVNTREKTWDKKEISYEQVVELAYDTSSDVEGTLYTVSYSDGPESNPDGLLIRGKRVHVQNGMIFNVKRTGRS